jgi:tetratricopeptide (TPR) repeat protein
VRTILCTLLLAACLRADWTKSFDQGEVLLAQGELDAARTAFMAALKDAADKGGQPAGLIYNGLGRLEFRAGRYRTAKMHYGRAMKILTGPPESRGALLGNAGQALLALGEYGEAERLFGEAVSLSPRNAGLLRLFGTALYLRRQAGQAETAFLQAISMSSTPADRALIRNDLAVLYDRDRRTAQAAELLQQAVPDARAGQLRARLLANRGLLFWKLGRREEALADLSQAVAEAEAAAGPTHPVLAHILTRYSFVLKRMGYRTQAREAERRAAASRAGSLDEPDLTGLTVDWRDLR